MSERRLRLEAMLVDELGALDDNNKADDAERKQVHVKVGDLVDKAADAGFGFLVGILAMIAVPFVGLSTPFGLAIVLIGAQMMIGRTKPWLPKRARKREITMHILDRVAGILARRTRWLARSTRPRWQAFILPRFVGFGVVLLALGLALPLPIPGSNLVFLIPIFIYAVGMLERDGLWVLVGHIALLLDIALLFAFGNVVVAVLSRIWHWVF